MHVFPHSHTCAHLTTPGTHPPHPTCICTHSPPPTYTCPTYTHALTHMPSIPASLHTREHTRSSVHAPLHDHLMAGTSAPWADGPPGPMLAGPSLPRNPPGLGERAQAQCWTLTHSLPRSLGGWGSQGQARASGIRSPTAPPTAGADHHHVRVCQPQRLRGARLPLRAQAAHHPLPAAEERGQPPRAHQPLRQHRGQGRPQPRPRSASAPTAPSACALPTRSLAWAPLTGLPLRLLRWAQARVGGGGPALDGGLGGQPPSPASSP